MRWSIPFVLAAVVASCGSQEAAAPAPVAEPPRPAPPEEVVRDAASAPPSAEALAAAEQQAYEAAKPVFEAHCGSCHTRGGSMSKKKKKALDHFSMDGYPFGGHHAHELGSAVREVLGVDGGKATMPKDDPGAVQGAELELVVAWSRAFDRARQAAGHAHGDHAHEH